MKIMFKRFKNILVVAVLAVGVVFGGNVMHLLPAGGAEHRGGVTASSNTQCLNACSVLPGERYKSLAFQEQDDDPDILAYLLVPTEMYFSLLSAVLLAAALLVYLRQRPPDLTLIYGTWRN